MSTRKVRNTVLALTCALALGAPFSNANAALLTYEFTGVWDNIAYDFVTQQYFTGQTVTGFLTIDTASVASGCGFFTCYVPLGAMSFTTHGSTYSTGPDNLRVISALDRWEAHSYADNGTRDGVAPGLVQMNLALTCGAKPDTSILPNIALPNFLSTSISFYSGPSAAGNYDVAASGRLTSFGPAVAAPGPIAGA